MAIQDGGSWEALVSLDVKLHSMKKTVLFVLSLSVTSIVFAQPAKPELLKQPDNWAFERFSMPPAFAPAITYKGFEELRFAPGMFKKDSIDYFAYAFIASIDSVRDISQKDIQVYLQRYYKGLCSQVAKDNKLTVDTSKITVAIVKNETLPGKEIIYNYSLNVFGVFADGAPVKLNMEAKVMKDVAHQKIYLLFITSPQPKTSVVWEKLHEIQRNFKIPAD
jgi:hypothetical protein